MKLHGRLIDVDDEENLQALCFSCNRGKRAGDNTEFRRRKKLVRDGIPALISAEGRDPEIKELKGRKLRSALYDKLTEEHAELLAAKGAAEKCEEIVDIIEVAIALAAQYGAKEADILELVQRKRVERGGFEKGFMYLGDRKP